MTEPLTSQNCFFQEDIYHNQIEYNNKYQNLQKYPYASYNDQYHTIYYVKEKQNNESWANFLAKFCTFLKDFFCCFIQDQKAMDAFIKKQTLLADSKIKYKAYAIKIPIDLEERIVYSNQEKERKILDNHSISNDYFKLFYEPIMHRQEEPKPENPKIDPTKNKQTVQLKAEAEELLSLEKAKKINRTIQEFVNHIDPNGFAQESPEDLRDERMNVERDASSEEDSKVNSPVDVAAGLSTFLSQFNPTFEDFNLKWREQDSSWVGESSKLSAKQHQALTFAGRKNKFGLAFRCVDVTNSIFQASVTIPKKKALNLIKVEVTDKSSLKM